MKKIFFGMMALVAFVATSCQQTPDLAEVGVGGETATVSFNLGTPQIASRADFSDGTTASHLQWAVYDANGNILNDLKGEMTDFQISTTVEFQLTTGNTYYVLFWAAADGAPYTVDLAAKTMTVNYTGAVSSDEKRDAFYYYDDFTVQNGMDPVKAELRRPFAQLNIGTNDFEASEKAGHKVTHAMVEVPAYSTLNFANGEVSDKAVRTFAYAAVPGASQEFPVNDAEYDYIAMNYLLMANTKETIDVVFTYATAYDSTTGVATNEKQRTVGSVPVQRNHRTNLYGQLFTSNAKANVTIEEEYVDDNKYGVENGQVYVKVANAEEFNAAFADEKVDIIILTDDIVLSELLTRTGSPSLNIKAGSELTLNLNGYTISGTDNDTKNFGLINNRGNLTVIGPGSLVLTATNDRGTNAYSSVISNNPGGNLTVEGGVVIEHLGGSYMAYGIDNLTNGKGTVAVTTVKDATVKSTYRAIRQFLNGIEATNELYVKAGAIVEGANKSIWMQDPSTKANTGKLVVEAGAQLKGDVYLFVTAGSTEWPVEVSIAKDTLIGESEVLTGNVPLAYQVVEKNGVWSVEDASIKVNNAEELAAALTSGAIVVLDSNIELEEAIDIQSAEAEITLDLNGKTLNSKVNYAIYNSYGATLRIVDTKNEAIVNGYVYTETGSTTIVDGGTYNTGVGGKYIFLNSGGTLIINNATINGCSSYSVYSYDPGHKLVINNATVNSTFGCIQAYGLNGVVEINNGTFQMTGVQGKTSHIAYFSNGDVTINNGTFKKIGEISMSTTGGGGVCAANGAKLVIKNGEFAGDHANTGDVYNYGGKDSNGRATTISIEGGTYKFKPSNANLAEGKTASENNGIWTVR